MIKSQINLVELYEVIFNPEEDKFIYLITELGDMGTIMLRNDDYYYRHNNKLINYLCEKFKTEIFFENNFQIFNNNDMVVNLEDLLIEKGNLRFEIKKKISKILFTQISRGLEHLHTSLISHRDLKPDNIVFSSYDNNCKIVDFSISTFFKKNINEEYLTNEPGGSIHFQAPEQFETGKHDPFIADIWSLGVTLYIFICEEFPFDAESEIELQIKICENEIIFPEYVDEQVKHLILSMLNKDFKNRINLKNIINKLEEF